ncbi:MAG: ABC transporter permease [Lentisphaerales bacterium]|nr:ABC transporter permease [Lentisphaerales bacterium]
MHYQSVMKTVILGLRSLWLHKLRSCLTMLGIIFGVGSVVTMLAVGEGASQQALDKIRKLGANNIIISAEMPQNAQKERVRMKIFGLKYNDIKSIEETCKRVRHIIPQKIINTQSMAGNKQMDVRLIGTSETFFNLVDRPLLAGRALSPFDLDNATEVCVISEKIARQQMNNDYTLGQHIMVKNRYFKIIGILESSDQSDQNSFIQPQDIIVPLTTLRKYYGDSAIETTSGSTTWEKVELHKIYVQTYSTDDIEMTAQSVERIFEANHPEKDYSISVPLALLKQTMETRRMFNIVLGAIAGISLLVGGIGIMNIMLANVTERIREIGIRRAIGAKKIHIVGQFLIETVVLSVLGGLIGIVCGISLPSLITYFTQMPTFITSGSILLAFGISASIGILFGLYPAYRAASLDPIKALRNE